MNKETIHMYIHYQTWKLLVNMSFHVKQGKCFSIWIKNIKKLHYIAENPLFIRFSKSFVRKRRKKGFFNHLIDKKQKTRNCLYGKERWI